MVRFNQGDKVNCAMRIEKLDRALEFRALTAAIIVGQFVPDNLSMRSSAERCIWIIYAGFLSP
jgi:hypothetical protein